MQDNYEATFEIVNEPIEINLELKQYVEKEERLRLVNLEYYPKDWVADGSGYKLEISANSHTLAKFSFNNFLLYDEESNTFASALCDYALGETDGMITLYSDYPCRCLVMLFGEGLV